MIRILLVAFLLFLTFPVKAQREKNWLIGQGYGFPNILVNFNNGIYTDTTTVHSIAMGNTKACISDTLGNLLFYTNGINIFSAQHDTMLNGTGLNPSNYTSQYEIVGLNIIQSALILPVPDSSNLYYLFHYTIDTIYPIAPPYNDAQAVQVFYYSKIDMSRNGGHGECVEKNVHLLDDTLNYGGLSAARHANGRDWWILMKKFNQPLYFTWLISPFGILGPYTQSIGPPGDMWGLWQGCFSRNGDKYATILAQIALTKDFYLYDFDRCSGRLSNMNHLLIHETLEAKATGCAFSPNGRFLYYSSRRFIYQFDTWATNIDSSRITVAVYDSLLPGFPTDFGSMQLAPDGKIYLSTFNSTDRLHVIEYPDSAGLACNVVQHAIQLPSYNGGSLPNIPNFSLGALAASDCAIVTGTKGIIENMGSVLVFPNPASEFVTIHFPVSLSSSIQCIITNVLGQEMLSTEIVKRNQDQIISVADFPPGMYFYNFIVKNDVQLNSGKFIVR